MGSGFVLGIVAAAVVALAVALGVVYSGAYNVAATSPHADLTRWAFDTTMHRSVRRRAEDLQLPGTVNEASVREAATTYASTCAHCHGGPGTDQAPWARNMRPAPPELAHAASKWETAEIFWIAKNGIKMTGMPAFAPEHSDEALWAIAAFVAQLPGLTPEGYRDLTGAASANAGHGDHQH